jgi:electron transport complex protein RnfB
MAEAILVLTALAAAFGGLLGFAAVHFRIEGDPVVDMVERLLPQTQCGQCGYPGCHPYAEAVAGGQADINQCVPGGDHTIRALADLLGKDAKPLDPAHGSVKPKMLAWIDEQLCIGCTLCIQVCPVDAILGAAKHMHTVIASECTGCEICPPVCPVDCIHMRAVEQAIQTWKWPAPETEPALVHAA